MTIDAFFILGEGIIYVAIWMLLLWILLFVFKNMAILDVGKPISIYLYVLHYAVKSPYINIPEAILLFTMGFWTMRTSSQIFTNRLYKQPEPRHYKHLRNKSSLAFAISTFVVFQLQGLCSLILSLPAFFIILDPMPNEWMLFIGSLICILAVFANIIWHLQKHSKRGGVVACPNYFWQRFFRPSFIIESSFWLGVAIMGQSAIYGSWSWLALVLVILYLSKIAFSSLQLNKSLSQVL